MIRQIQAYFENPEVLNAPQVAIAFDISPHTAARYIQMTEDEIQRLDSVQTRMKRSTQADDYVNIIYKMQRDGYPDDIICHYVIRQGYKGNNSSLLRYMFNISRNNFTERKAFHPKHYMKWQYPADIIVIKRSSLLRYILTINPNKKKDETIGCYIDKIKEKYPVVEATEKMFSELHTVIMGKNPDAINGYIEKYGDTKIAGFCIGIKNDIAPVRNAISMDVSSGFVEGNNNKFKLIKRILYGRAGLVNLAKKCMLAFAVKNPDFSLQNLL